LIRELEKLLCITKLSVAYHMQSCIKGERSWQVSWLVDGFKERPTVLDLALALTSKVTNHIQFAVALRLHVTDSLQKQCQQIFLQNLEQIRLQVNSNRSPHPTPEQVHPLHQTSTSSTAWVTPRV